MVNLQDLAARLHGPEFAAYLTSEFTPFDLLMHLARAYQTVLLPGVQRAHVGCCRAACRGRERRSQWWLPRGLAVCRFGFPQMCR
jgi:hypothetical protein